MGPNTEARPGGWRRKLKRTFVLLVVLGAAGSGGYLYWKVNHGAASSGDGGPITLSQAPITSPENALAELKAGNERFVEEKRVRSTDSVHDAELRAQLANEQHPFAVVVTCSDSRVEDNILFDQEPGRLFTVREAGNGADQQGLASIEYAVGHLGESVVVVMGHTKCGAVRAVRDAKGEPLPGNMYAFQSSMAGLTESTPKQGDEAEDAYLARLVEANARRQAKAILTRSEEVARRVHDGRLRVVPAVYDLASGRVSFLEN
jgi:carbonic anhydrase